jgi:hypothetical protein
MGLVLGGLLSGGSARAAIDLTMTSVTGAPSSVGVGKSFGRDNLWLHRPGLTRGCIAAKDWSGWGQARSLLDNTRTDTVPDMFAPWPWSSTGRPIRRYGILFVVNCGP